MAQESGFEQGCGCVFGVVFALCLLFGGCHFLGQVYEPCPSCHTSGNCMLCSGSGKGVLFGDCMNCGGKKRCPNCGGSGFKKK